MTDFEQASDNLQDVVTDSFTEAFGIPDDLYHICFNTQCTTEGRTNLDCLIRKYKLIYPNVTKALLAVRDTI